MFLENQHIIGYHFRLKNSDSSDTIREQIHLGLKGIIDDLVPSRYYVDRESFDRIDSMMDYSLLLKK